MNWAGLWGGCSLPHRGTRRGPHTLEGRPPGGRLGPTTASRTLSALRSEEGHAWLTRCRSPFPQIPQKRTIRSGEDCTHLLASEWIPSMQEFPSKHSTVRALNSKLSQLHLGMCPWGSALLPPTSVPVSTLVTWEQYWTASPGLF